MVRDLLIESWRRDRRLWMYRELCINRPRWMAHGVERAHGVVADKSSTTLQALHLRAMHFVHLHHLACMDELAFDDDDLRRVIRNLKNCWPEGYLAEWRANGVKTPGDVCRMSRHCPFCLARTVLKLHDRIHSMLKHDNNIQFLVSGKLKLTDDHFEFSNLDLQKRITFIRKKIGREFVKAAKAVGVDGGIIVFQISPHRFTTTRWCDNECNHQNNDGYLYELSILGGVSSRLSELVNLESQQQSRHDLPTLSGVPLYPQWCYRTVKYPQALRHLLVGTSFGYCKHDIDEGVTGYAVHP